MSLLWLVMGVSLVIALAAWNKARRTSRRLAQLFELYWELKYQHGELRAELQRTSAGAADASITSRHPEDAFVPLTSLRR